MKERRPYGKDCSSQMGHRETVKRAATWAAWGIIILMALFLTGFLWIHWEALCHVFTSGDPSAAMRDFIAGFGVWGALILVLFQTLQIVVAILPGEPIELAAGMMYGGFPGALLCLAGVLLGTYTVFFAVQKLGSGLIAAFHGESRLKRLHNLRVFRYEKNAELLTFILFLIPGLPKDFFTFVAPLTPIGIHRFVLISTLARAPGMLITTYAGKSLLEGNLVLAGCLYGLLGLSALISLLFYRQLLKRERADEKQGAAETNTNHN